MRSVVQLLGVRTKLLKARLLLILLSSFQLIQITAYTSTVIESLSPQVFQETFQTQEKERKGQKGKSKKVKTKLTDTKVPTFSFALDI